MSKKLEAIASAMGVEFTSVRAFNNEYSYQHGRYVPRVYCDGARYYCVSDKKPKNDASDSWVLHPDQFWAEKAKTKLWVG